MDIDHRPSEDTLVITLSTTPPSRTEELSEGVFFLYAPSGKLVGIRIDQVNQRFDLVEELIPTGEDTPSPRLKMSKISLLSPSSATEPAPEIRAPAAGAPDSNTPTAGSSSWVASSPILPIIAWN